MCDLACRQALATTLCSALRADVDIYPPSANAELLLADHALPLLNERATVLLRELACSSADIEAESDVDGTPPLKAKSVENGKSGSGFLVPGAAHVDPDAGSSYSAIFKQVNAEEAKLLPSIYPELVAHYSRRGGSLLTPVLGWLRYTPPDSNGVNAIGSLGEAPRPFECLLMENAARPPPGGGSYGTPWRTFDMKGIRLYKHEKRYEASFGSHGLRIGQRKHGALRKALEADVEFLTTRNLVDFSYLLSVFPTGGAPRPCEAARRDSDYHRNGKRNPTRGLLAALHHEPLHGPEMDVETVLEVETAASEVEEEQAGKGDAAMMCVPVVLRIGIIDYLRAWSITERFEHVQKSITRDLLAGGQRNHAVVPVREFGERFIRYFDENLFTPMQPPGWRESLEDAVGELKGALAALHLRWPLIERKVRHVVSTATPKAAASLRYVGGVVESQWRLLQAQLKKGEEEIRRGGAPPYGQ